ncbi:MAG: hypothetical protein IJ806_06845 [Ruminococcus sp.]|nr:hypothetical protein [Ruminococcus sp.]
MIDREDKELGKMTVYILMLMGLAALIFNEWDAGERWYIGLIRSVAVIWGSWKMSAVIPGQLMMLAVVGLSAVLAAELYRLDTKKKHLAEHYARTRRSTLRMSSRSSAGAGKHTA